MHRRSARACGNSATAMFGSGFSADKTCGVRQRQCACGLLGFLRRPRAALRLACLQRLAARHARARASCNARCDARAHGCRCTPTPRSKTALRLVCGRVRLVSNKKEAAQRALRREIADLVAAGKMDSARIRVRCPRTRASRNPRVVNVAARAAPALAARRAPRAALGARLAVHAHAQPLLAARARALRTWFRVFAPRTLTAPLSRQVEGLMREERLVCAYEILDLFLQLLVQRLAVLEKAKCVLTDSPHRSMLLCASMR